MILHFFLSFAPYMSPFLERRANYRSADSEERAESSCSSCAMYRYLAESIATVALGWNTRYEDMRYGRLIREIKI